MRAGKRISVGLIALLLLAVLAIAGLGTLYAVIAAGRITGEQTVVMAPEVMRPGAQTSIRAIVQDYRNGEPIARADVTMRLEPRDGGKALALFKGKTDANGQVQAAVWIPEDAAPNQTLVVETSSGVGSSKLERVVQVQRDSKLLLTTDKPLYQPGQTVHIRSLALNAGDLSAVSGQDLQFTIEDPKGNKVHRSTATTSDWGIASLDFDLAAEVNQGTYKITAQLGQTTTEKTVTVKPYVLPKFGIKLQTDRAYYAPGDTVKGTLEASYFFGKPVSDGQVEIVGSVYEIERQEVLHLQGTTDDQGRFEFSLDLPSYFVGGTLEQGKATFGLEITVIDQADHAESTASTLPIAEQPLLIDAVPESGVLKPGVENLLYILTSYPDGSPAQAKLNIRIDSQSFDLQSGEYGLATLSFTPPTGIPPTMDIQATDAQGNSSRTTLSLPFESADEYVLLRPELAAYKVGDTMHVDILASANQGTAYLDIIRDGQTLSTRALDIRDGLASADIDLDETLFGTLQLHAYKVLRDATIAGDTRLVVVDRASDIALDVSLDKETYLPGDMAKLVLQSTVNGQPVPAALGLSIVDESVFALQEQDAGFAKLYFLLQAEILQPRYQLKWFQPKDVLLPTSATGSLKEAEATAAQAVVAGAAGAAPAALADSRGQKAQAIEAEQQQVYSVSNDWLSRGLLAMGVIGLIVSVVAVIRSKTLGKTLLYGFLALVAMAVISAAMLFVLFAARYSGSADDRLITLTVGLLGLSVLGLIASVVAAWRSRDTSFQGIHLLLGGCLLILWLAAFTAARADPYGWEDRMGGPTIALALILLAIYLRGISLEVAGKKGGIVGVVASALGLMPVALIGLYFVTGGPMAQAMPQALDVAPMMGGAPAEAPWALAMERVVRETVVAEKQVQAVHEDEAATPAAQEPPRLRQFFPETMYWNPQVLTDESGVAEVEIPVADSITTWRLSALASSQQGQLGSITAGMRVFQDFFIDLDLPLYLTQNDEVSLPVAVYNYLPNEQSVRLEVQQEPWFELLDDQVKTMTIASNDVEVVYFRIKAIEFGLNRFQVTAWGETMSDAIVKEVQVMPDGKVFRSAQGDNLTESVSQAINIPDAAIAGTPRIWVKVYPGIVSQIVEGLSGLLRMPFG